MVVRDNGLHSGVRFPGVLKGRIQAFGDKGGGYRIAYRYRQDSSA